MNKTETRRSILFEYDCILSFNEFIFNLNKIYKNLNTDNIDFLKEKYDIYLELFSNYRNGKITLKTRFSMSILGFKNITNTRSIEYYENMGYNHDMAKLKLIDMQSNNSLKNIMKRNRIGIDDAKEKLQEYSKKRIDTIRNKYTDEEIAKINYKKGKSLRYEYWLYKINPNTGRYYSEDEAKKELTLRQLKANKQHVNNIKDGKYDKGIFNTSIEYWINKTDTLEDAYRLLHDRQATFTLKKCVERYGLEKGSLIFEERQARWQKTMNDKPLEERIRICLKKFRNNKFKFYSDESIKYFEKLIEILKNYDFNFEYRYKESELFLNRDTKIFFYDFTIDDLKIIIEYQGSHIHPSPYLTESEKQNWKNVYNKKTYNECVEYDLFKKEIAESYGYKVYQIWDFERYTKLNFIIKEIKDEFYKRTNVG